MRVAVMIFAFTLTAATAVPAKSPAAPLSSTANSADYTNMQSDRIIKMFKDIDAGLQFTIGGVCMDYGRKVRRDRLLAQYTALRTEFTHRTGRKWDDEFIIVEGNGCEGDRYFDRNMNSLSRQLRELKSMIHQ